MSFFLDSTESHVWPQQLCAMALACWESETILRGQHKLAWLHHTGTGQEKTGRCQARCYQPVDATATMDLSTSVSMTLVEDHLEAVRQGVGNSLVTLLLHQYRQQLVLSIDS